jgi:hypothetical protein
MSTDDFFRHAEEMLFPKIQQCSLSVAIFNGRPDPKLCMELGAAILFDKPIILVVPDSQTKIPANLKRLASIIIVGDLSDPEISRRMQDAITAVLDNDRRVEVKQ